MAKSPLRAVVITLSKRVAAGERNDLGGDAVTAALEQKGWQVIQRFIIPDSYPQLVSTLQNLCDSNAPELIITTGGTGLSKDDITPEATLAVIEKRLPGIELAMFRAALAKTPHAMLSRAIAGARKETLIINLPGSPKGAVENLVAVLPVLPHAVQVLRAASVPDASHRF